MRQGSLRSLWLPVAGLFVAAFLAAQLVRPALPSTPAPSGARSVWQDPSVPPVVGAILHRSCADCHSLETHWPWYAHLAPASWLVASDVRRARGHMNLSDWPRQPDIEKAEIGDMVVNRVMPPKRYLFMHSDARLSDADRKTILAWVQDNPK